MRQHERFGKTYSAESDLLRNEEPIINSEQASAESSTFKNTIMVTMESAFIQSLVQRYTEQSLPTFQPKQPSKKKTRTNDSDSTGVLQILCCAQVNEATADDTVNCEQNNTNTQGNTDRWSTTQSNQDLNNPVHITPLSKIIEPLDWLTESTDFRQSRQGHCTVYTVHLDRNRKFLKFLLDVHGFIKLHCHCGYKRSNHRVLHRQMMNFMVKKTNKNQQQTKTTAEMKASIGEWDSTIKSDVKTTL